MRLGKNTLVYCLNTFCCNDPHVSRHNFVYFNNHWHPFSWLYSWERNEKKTNHPFPLNTLVDIKQICRVMSEINFIVSVYQLKKKYLFLYRLVLTESIKRLLLFYRQVQTVQNNAWIYLESWNERIDTSKARNTLYM